MIAVIFELTPNQGCMDEYLQLAEQLKVELCQMDGFISVERFESLSEPGRYLSLSFWRDETAIQHWRNLPAHRQAQAKGRSGLFSHYRLRVAQVLRDYGLHQRLDTPADSQRHHGADDGTA
ncbi:antibiotic biosynthesis monooxygenase family protein [Bowmanella denitrificans]|uniref:antibiotic biosynthesis monooxygenase family protein n=1 Tax=Bowmanella denitrificans TaxID=366582 RepID=UPI000C9A710B|nr:antibiotic biosynthesis monooxygenase [Bowmanella denitrificans]